MTDQLHTNPAVRHDALLLIDVKDSNPNGDPDAGNQPRTDPETGQGLITDVSLKRKVRDTIALVGPDQPSPERYGIYVTAGTALNTVHDLAYDTLGKAANPESAQRWLREHYFDIRMFGAVMTTGEGKKDEKRTAGRLTGPVQFGIARSVDPVMPAELAITRVTKTKAGEEGSGEMGTKWVVPYGLYIARVHYSASLGKAAEVTPEDLRLLWSALLTMWDHTRSAARADISTRGLYVFSHESALGNAPAHRLIESISVSKKDDVAVTRSFSDYDVAVPAPNALPSGVTLTSL